MNYDQFTAEWNGRQVTKYGGECVACIAEFEAENNLPIVWGDAHVWINNPIMLQAYDWVVNKPNDPNQLPPRGAIIVWPLPNEHIAFFDHNLDNHEFVSFGQNSGGIEAHFQPHSWNNVAGWYIRKQAAPAPAPPPVIITPPTPPPAPPPMPTLAAPTAAPLPYPTSTIPYVLVTSVVGYATANDAVNDINGVKPLPEGSYFLFNRKYGMDNITSVKDRPGDLVAGTGGWINPKDNVLPPEPVKPQTVIPPWNDPVEAPTSPALSVEPPTPQPVVSVTQPVHQTMSETLAAGDWKSTLAPLRQDKKAVIYNASNTIPIFVEDLDKQHASFEMEALKKNIPISYTFSKDGVLYGMTPKVKSLGWWHGVPMRILRQQTIKPVNFVDTLQLTKAHIEDDIKFLELIPKWYARFKDKVK